MVQGLGWYQKRPSEAFHPDSNFIHLISRHLFNETTHIWGHTNPPKPRVNSLHVYTCMSVGRMTSLGGKDEGCSNINCSRGRYFHGRQTNEYQW